MIGSVRTVGSSSNSISDDGKKRDEKKEEREDFQSIDSSQQPRSPGMAGWIIQKKYGGQDEIRDGIKKYTKSVDASASYLIFYSHEEQLDTIIAQPYSAPG